MLPAERRQHVVNEIIKRHTVTIQELAHKFSVSEMTIRRDLAELEKAGLVESVHKGAKSPSLSPFELSYTQRELMEVDAKRAIGHAAAQLVKENEVIALDGSTTTLQVARNLIDRKNLTIYTNGIRVAIELAQRPGIRTILTGGEIYLSVSLVGHLARAAFEKIHVDKLILSVTGITEDLGLSGPSDVDADIKAAMIAAADQVILVADHTKFGRKSYMRVAALDALDVVVTDEQAPMEYVALLERLGIQVIIASPLVSANPDIPSKVTRM